MRRDAARLATAASGLGDGATGRARHLRRWYGAYRAELEGHHELEDQLWFPVLADRVPTFGEHSERIAREHHLLDHAVAGLGHALDRLSDDAGPSSRGDASDAARELRDLLDAHLGFEDDDIVPLYLRHFTADDFVDVERRTRKMLDKRRAPFAVPWIMGAADAEERIRVLERAPLAFKLLWYAGRGRHTRLTTRALGPALQEVA